jgi:hypothetical protein
VTIASPNKVMESMTNSLLAEYIIQIPMKKEIESNIFFTSITEQIFLLPEKNINFALIMKKEINNVVYTKYQKMIAYSAKLVMH